MKKRLHDSSLNSQRGSVLMEFVLVLPLYIAALGGILLMGLRSLDTINLRSADLWNVFEAGNRFTGRLPAIISLQDMFPRANIILSDRKLALQKEKSYLKTVSGGVSILESEWNFMRDWLNTPYTLDGDSQPFVLPYATVSSSRYDNKYTRFIVMRSQGSKTSKRHWKSALLAKEDIWKFDSDDDIYPKEWNWKGTEKAASSSDKFTEEEEPQDKIEFYKRFKKFEKWSVKPE